MTGQVHSIIGNHTSINGNGVYRTSKANGNNTSNDPVQIAIAQGDLRRQLAERIINRYKNNFKILSNQVIEDVLNIPSPELTQLDIGYAALIKANLEEIPDIEIEDTNLKQDLNNAIFNLTSDMKPGELKVFAENIESFFNLNHEPSSELVKTEMGVFDKRLQFLQDIALIKSKGLNMPILNGGSVLNKFNDEDVQNKVVIAAELLRKYVPRVAKQFLQYRALSEDTRTIINKLLSRLDEPESNNFDYRFLLNDFLTNRRNFGEFEKAKQFLQNLYTVQTFTYEDDSRIYGAENILYRALEADKGNDMVHGYYFEPQVAINLIERGFKIEGVSVTGKQFTDPDDSRKEREIDIIATKTYDDMECRFFIDAKSSYYGIIKSHEKGQLKALVKLSKKFDAVPVLVVDTRISIDDGTGHMIETSSIDCRRDKANKIRDVLIKYPSVLIWDENGYDITDAFLGKHV